MKRVTAVFLGGLMLLAAGCRHPRRTEEPRPLTVTSVNELPADLPSPSSLTLEQTLRTALERNRGLRIAELDPLRALTEVDSANAEFSPEAFGSVQLAEEEASETARSTGERFSVEADGRESEAGIRSVLETGTELEASVSERLDESNRAPTQQEVRAGVSVTQPLLRGFGTRVNRIRVEQAVLGVELSREELRAVTMALLAEVELAYWNLRLAQQAVEITETALEVAEKQFEETRERIEVGQLPRNQLAAVEAEVAVRRQDVIDAEANRATRAFQLNRILFTSPDTRITSTEALVLPEDPIEDGETLVELALQFNPEIREARVRLQQGELEVERTRDGIRPRLDLFAELAKTGFGDSFSQATDEFSGDTYEWLAGIRVGQDLGTSRAKAAFQDAQFSLEQAELAVENLERDLESRVRSALVEYNRALDQVKAGEQTVRLREQSAQAEQDRFEVGLGTSLLVAQAQRDLLESQIADLRNRLASRTARVSLLELTGLLLEESGVTVGP